VDVRIAVLADIHGNLPALRAVLAEIDREPVDAIVVGGDIAGGPLVRESLELLDSRPEPVHWVRGNGEREALAVHDGEPASDDPPGRAAVWSAGQLDRGWRDRLASWPIAMTLDGTLFCHGSPRRDDEMLTRATPDAVLAEAVAGVDEPLVVGGHTHQQFIRPVAPDRVMANAGSVGMPYEGRAGAFWMVVDGGRVDLRETRYDFEGAVDELRASGYPDVDTQIGEALLSPVDPDWVTAFFEHLAGRGEHPGEPPGEPGAA
jgi:predicted phosphodiesterase